MWPGMTYDHFEIAYPSLLYRPTGLLLTHPDPVPHGDIRGPEIITNINDPDIRIELEFWSEFWRYRTDQGITPEIYDTMGIIDFLKKYGLFIDLRSARSVGSKHYDWTNESLTAVLNLKFFSCNIESYYKSEKPNPDRIIVSAPEIPLDLHGIYRIPFLEEVQ